MPAVKTKRISTLIETQLPEFISSEYELFSKFVQKYYEAQEVQGGTLDVINNIQKYADIDFYEKNILKQHDSLTADISATDTTITVSDAQSFPKKNGYVRIGDEIIFYATRTGTELQECSRGVSGNTSLGDLYEASNFTSTDASSHNAGEKVFNVSNLFLYALVKNFENQYLGSFPEKYLKGEVDKRTLIKNISKFYKAKGTTSSIKFIFNTIVAQDVNNKPSVYKPKDFTYKSSNSDWINVYALKCKLVSGNLTDLIGQKVVQESTTEYGYASATVDNVYADSNKDGEGIYNIVLAPETVNGDFAVSTKTKLTKQLSGVASTGNRIDVFSTQGWGREGSILVGEETITFKEKSATQFVIANRPAIGAVQHSNGSSVYKPVEITGAGVKLVTFGVVYNFDITDGQPHAAVGDVVQVSNPGFRTTDPKIVKVGTNETRWLLSNGSSPSIPTYTSLQSELSELPTDVTSIHEDDQYYYITSSSLPSHAILDGSVVDQTILDQKILRLIRKRPSTSTENYKTPKADTGIMLNGVRAYSYKDTESIRYGKLEEIKVDLQGRGYNDPPFVLIDQVPNKARAVLAGQVVESIIVDTDDIFPRTPEITITSGRRAEVRAVVTGGKVTSLIIDNPGEYYSTPPQVRIRDNAGRGRFASFTSITDANGSLVGFEKIDEGNFYTQDTVVVDIIPVGEGAVGLPFLKEWNFNRYEKLGNNIDQNGGYLFENRDPVLKYGYGYIGNPKALRVALGDNLSSGGTELATKVHSPIIGFAYDGNPIYGAFGHENPLDPSSPIVRMTSGYSLKGTRSGGPSTTQYSLGTFVDDYQYIHRNGSLDENNGRFCITPEFPQGVYAYFITIDSNQVPQFPYIVGDSFYSLPVDSNYNSDINQLDIPKTAKRFETADMSRNGEGVIAQIGDIVPGTVDTISVVGSSDNFSVNSKIYFNNQGTDGSEVEANVESVKGKSVNYLQSKESKVVKLTTIQTAYLFEDDTLRQPSSSASGTIVGTVASSNIIVLKDVVGTFDTTGTFSADIKTFTILLDQDSSYTEGATLLLTDGVNLPIAKGEVLEGTNRQNVVKIKAVDLGEEEGYTEATTSNWIVDENYYLQSDDLFNTVGSRIVTLTSLSDNLEPFEVNQSVALVETAQAHGLGINDKVTIDINPDDTTKLKTYYIRKRLYQEATLLPPVVNSTIDFTGIGRFQILNGGFDYEPGVYEDVPITGGSGTGATATITVSAARVVSSVILTNRGSGYSKADYLGVDDESLQRLVGSDSTARLAIYVDHVGFAAGMTDLRVARSSGYAVGDLLTVGNEVVEIAAIDGFNLTVVRAREGTKDGDHYNGKEVSLYKPTYNFAPNFQVFEGNGSGYIQSYDRDTQKIIVAYDYATTEITANELTNSSSFFESSDPQRLVSVNFAGDLIYKFEFSEDDVTFTPNPNINIQEFYKYKFDTSHSSLTGTYFDLSPSRNYNLETLEKTATTILPGNAGSFTDVKFGFGARLSSNNYQTKRGTSFTNFYYFDRKNIVNAEGAYLSIVTDPLQGVKTVNYVTPTRFVYNIPSEPLWDGSGSISYTTTGQFSVGEINTAKVTNLGLNYRKVPVVEGVDPSVDFRASATVLFDPASKVITGVDIKEKGSNYSVPKVVITRGDGVGATFDIVVRNGEIFSITIRNAGRGYTFAPEIAIIEGDVKLYADSETIGVPQSLKITNNGGAFHLDKTVASTFNSNFVVSLKDFNGDFRRGETVVQRIGNVEVFRAVVTEWRFGSRLLKLKDTQGIVRENVALQSLTKPVSGIVTHVFVSTFSERITSFYDNLGFYKSDRGRIGNANQRITDSFFYQDYSYVVKSKTPIDQWRELIKSTTHPAGFKLFGEVDIEGTASTEMPEEMPKASHYAIIQLWDPDKNKITVESTKQVITQTVQTVENQRIRKAVGSASTSEFNFNEIRTHEVKLAKPFDGINGVDAARISGSVTRVATYNENETFEVVNIFGATETKTVPATQSFVLYKVSVIDAKTGTGYSGTEEQFTVDLSDLENWGLAVNTSGYSGSSSQVGTAFGFPSISAILSGNGDNPTDVELPEGVGSIIYNNGSIWPLASAYGKFLYNNSDNTFFGSDRAYLFDHPTFGRCFAIKYQTSGYYDYPEVFPTGWRVGDTFRWYLNGFYNNSTQTGEPDRFGHIDFRVDAITFGAGGTGSYDGTANNVGTTTFQLLDENNQPFTPYDAKNLIVTLDGVLQEPGVSYTVQDDKIIFSEAPLGPSSKQTGEDFTDVTQYNRTGPNTFVGTTFYAKYVAFKDNQYNDRYFKKLKNIFQRQGRWIDAANQVERNIDFIIEEAIGYGKATHPTLDWSTKQDDYERDIRNILEAYDHDIRFGGNVKTTNYVNIFNESSDYLYIQNYRTESSDIFKYVSRLAKLAIRNWDYTDINVNFLAGSRLMTISNTDNVAVGMFVSAGRAYPSGTKIVSIDSETQITLSNPALANSGGAGGAPVGNTPISGTAPANTTFPTTTASVAPGETYDVPPGITVTVPTSFSASDQATFSWSGINNGTFYDAGNLVAKNKAYAQEVIGDFVYTNYPSLPSSDKEKCKRDLGYFIDAISYHLKFGGNQTIVEYAQLYYEKAKYPEPEKRSSVKSDTEIAATLYAWENLRSILTQAVRNELSADYNGVSPFNDPSILIDTEFPACTEVVAAIDAMISVMEDILQNGRGVVTPTSQNANKSGNWSTTPTYSNYNIILDPLLLAQECSDVISSVDSLYDNIDDILSNEVVTQSLPDFVDGETKEFDLFWEDGSNVVLEKEENLFLTLNAVLQRPKYTENYPLFDAYFIDKEVIPNRIKFDVAPIWDQDLSAKTIGEPTAVERVLGIGVGNYRRLTIDYDLADGTRTGPFLILDVEDGTVQSVENPDSLYVFLDGVLQREGYSYTVAGPNIFFNVPIQKEVKIDMRYLYGRDVGQILNIYDYSPDTYFAEGVLTLDIGSSAAVTTFLSYTWMQDKVGLPIHAWQVKADGTYNILGEVRNPYRTSTQLTFDIRSQNASVIDGLDIVFATLGYYDRNIVIPWSDITGTNLTFVVDESGRKLLRDDNALWSGTVIGKSYRNPFVYLSNGDKIRVEGEDKFRKIKRLPLQATSKDGRPGEMVTNNIFGAVDVESYTGITRGEGLSVIAEIKNGKVLEVAIQNAGSDYSDATGIAIPEFTETIDGVDVKKFGLVIDITTTDGAVTYIKIVEGGENYDIGDVIEIPGGTDGTFTINNVLDGYVSNLTWNQRSYEPLTQPTAYQYYTPPVLNFVPENGEGGGAQANVLVSKGQVISVDLIHPGEGYTKAPRVAVSRRFEILGERDIGISLINLRVVNQIQGFGMSVISTIDTLSDAGLSNVTTAAVVLNSVVDKTLKIEVDIHPASTNPPPMVGQLQEIRKYAETLADDVEVIDVFHTTTVVDAKIQDIASINSITSVSRVITTSFENLIPNDALSNINYYETGAYLQVDLDPTDEVVYVADTAKFDPFGQLLIGNEMVKYDRKISDRFLNVARGTKGTTPQFWAAGTFMRQVPEIAVTFAGVVSFESESDVKMVSATTTATPIERVTQRQISSPADFSITREALEVVITPPPGGVVDGYTESAYIADPVLQRNGNAVDLVDVQGLYYVRKRNLTEIQVINDVYGVIREFIGQYTKTNAFHRIKHFDGIFDPGFANVSGFTIEEFDLYYGAITIRDFAERGNSQYTLAKRKFNLVPPSIQNPVQIATATTTISGGSFGGGGTTITVSDTYLFPDSGYLMVRTTGVGFGLNIISYTGKTATTFTGCEVIREHETTPGNGGFIVSGTTEIIPTTII